MADMQVSEMETLKFDLEITQEEKDILEQEIL